MSIYDKYAPDDYDTETLYQEWIERCTTADGDKYTGEFYREMLTWYFKAVDKNGDEYDTTEEPAIHPDLVITQFPDGTPEETVKEYFYGPQPVPDDPRIFNHPGQDKPITDFFKRLP
jgi:hypothetical protein